MERLVRFNSGRRFGLEYEFSNRYSFTATLASTARQHTSFDAQSRGYEHTRGNDVWVAKTDSSCGTELVSPILRGWRNLKEAAELLPHLRSAGARISSRCGQHVHIEVADCTPDQVAAICAHWIKIERFMLSAHPAHRRSNGYCSPANYAGASRIEPNRRYTANEIIRACGGRNAINLGNCRIDTHSQSCSGTVEFRFGDMTFNPETIKCRTRFLITFVEAARVLGIPANLNWYTPKEALRMLGLYADQSSRVTLRYSRAMHETRIWVCERFLACCPPNFERDHQWVAGYLEEIQNTEPVEIQTREHRAA